VLGITGPIQPGAIKPCLGGAGMRLGMGGKPLLGCGGSGGHKVRLGSRGRCELGAGSCPLVYQG
jgi:hypothetical protein